MSKVVLITGGSSGIGKAIGEFLFHKGFTVYGTSRNPEKITNSLFPLLALDVRNTESIQHAVAKVIAISKRIDVVINNAGIGITGPLEEIPAEEFKNIFESNFFGQLEENRNFFMYFVYKLTRCGPQAIQRVNYGPRLQKVWETVI
jgi:NAD(P)-dependent dehydrogenase (short-subunit alcohol dehydrogenase family)